MSLVDASTACPSGCTTHGVCDPIGRRCECPLTRTGPACEQLLLPACAVGGQPLHPTYFLHKGWERRVEREQWVGPLTCACIDQMAQLRNLVLFNNPWVAKARHRIFCARAPAGEDVGALLAAPQNATWEAIVMGLRGTSQTSVIAVRPPPVEGLGWFRTWPERRPAAARPAAPPRPRSSPGTARRTTTTGPDTLR